MRILMVLIAPFIAQIAFSADLKLSVEVVDSGKLADESGKVQLFTHGFSYQPKTVYDIHATIVNVSKQELSVAFMACAWFDSFRIKPTRSLSIDGWDCNANFPTSHDLGPGAEAVFRFQVTAASGKAPPKRFKIGFVADLTPFGEHSRFMPGYDPKLPVVWSGWINLPPPGEKLLPLLNESPPEPPSPDGG